MKFSSILSLLDYTVDFIDKLPSLENHYIDKDLKLVNATIEIHDPRLITPLQRAKIFAMIGDICIHQDGFRDKLLIANYRYDFEITLDRLGLIDYETFSLSSCSVTQANIYIEFLLRFMFDHDISLEYKTAQMMKDEWVYLFKCIQKRKCACAVEGVCTKNVEIHHATHLVGMGNKRSKHDHENSTFIALCDYHHKEAHNMGLEKFLETYKIKPIKLTENQIEELRI